MEYDTHPPEDGQTPRLDKRFDNHVGEALTEAVRGRAARAR